MPQSLHRLPKVGAFLLAGAVFGSACGDLPTDSNAAARSLLPTRASAAAAASPAATVTRVDIYYVSGGIDQKTWTIPIGATAQFGATRKAAIVNAM